MKRDRIWRICLIISLLTALFYGCIDLQTAFSGDWIIQDDARQHVFWLARYVDPELFPNDLIADYFQSVAPLGYTSFYRVGIANRIDPFTLSKLIPIPLRIISAYYFFVWCRTIFPVPSGCLTATLLMNHSLWLKNDIISATPRAFLHPFFLAFLYYFNQQALIPCLISLIGLSLFYPQMVFVAWGMLLLKLIHWRNFLPRISPQKKDRNFALAGLMVGILVLLPYALKTSDYAPVITRAEALTMAEFQDGGRSEFFKDTIWEYIFCRGRAVMISPTAFRPLILVTSLFLPFLIKNYQKFPLVKKITPHFNSISKLLLASFAMYVLAHLFLFKLHLPSRYTGNSLRIVVNLCGGIVISTSIDFGWRYCKKRYSSGKSKVLVTTAIIAIAIVAYTNFFNPYSFPDYKVGSYPQLYKYLQQQPKNIVVASLSREADYIPSFSQRSVLVSQEYAIPYQLGYYKPFKNRVQALIQAQYSLDLAEVQAFIKQHNITHWLIEDHSFDAKYVADNDWLKGYKKEREKALSNLKSNQTPTLLLNKNTCTAFTTGKLIVIDAKCLLSINI